MLVVQQRNSPQQGERGEYALVASLVSDPSQTATANVIVANPLVVHPTEAIVTVGESQDFEASVDDGLSIDWSTQYGSVVRNGFLATYTAHTAFPDTLTVFVQGDTSKKFDVPITVVDNKLSPFLWDPIEPNETVSFSWRGAESLPVIWTASAGTVTSDGVYSAPSAVGSYTVTATLAQDSTVSVSANVQVAEPPFVLISESADGTLSNGDNRDHSVSADGRYVVFKSEASNLVLGDTNGTADIFLKDVSTGAIERISVDVDGVEANGWSGNPTVTIDGRYVVFVSSASNLVPEDTNNKIDVFLKDVSTGVIERVNVDVDGNQGNLDSGASFNILVPFATADGRYVVFGSYASNLVPEDTNGKADIFLKDLTTGTIERISVDVDGNQGNLDSLSAFITADGRYVVFSSEANNLVLGDTNNTSDVFLRDLLAGTIQRISTDANGVQGNRRSSSHPNSITTDGRYVVFSSEANNLVLGDTNNKRDIFLKDVTTGSIQRISVSPDGTQANNPSFAPSISADGRYIVFASTAYNFGLGDTTTDSDIFVKDVTTGVLQLVTVSVRGYPTSGFTPLIATDGRYMVFASYWFSSFDASVVRAFNPFLAP